MTNHESHSADPAIAGSVVEITTTLPSIESARTVAHELLSQRLVACVQILGPIESHYRWQDAIEQAQEWKLFIKTSSTRTQQTIEKIQSSHPYDVPEILVFKSVDSTQLYETWIKSSC